MKKKEESRFAGEYEIVSTPKEKELEEYIRKTRKKMDER